MKKIITVLFAVLAIISIIYNITILFDNISEERVVFTDTSWKDFDEYFQNKSIEEIIDYFNKDADLTFSKYNVEQLDKYAKKYNVYYVGDYNYNWFRYIVKLNDKEQLEITYNIRAK